MSDRELLNAALEGLLLEQSRVDDEIMLLRRELQPERELGPRRLQQMSGAGRARIAAAQKKRWAAFREKKKQA